MGELDDSWGSLICQFDNWGPNLSHGISHGLPKGSVAPRPESGTAPPAPVSDFDTAGSSRVLADAAKRKRPSERGQTPKRKKARSVARSSREETEPDIIVRRVASVPSVAPIPEETVSASPLPSVGEGLLVPAPRSGETSSEDTPLQRKRSGEAAAAEADKRTDPVPESEALTGARPSPEHEPAATAEPPAFAENIEADPSLSTPDFGF
ncbi:uncharacterized protein LOC132613274 [Lycium barbarum]|uniref:uncharacterized protein LOC132613274 n=1 Tax=Lycium barbarum TaxID=112863 RepID=UPI00293F7240|nr:uncharacterized protein LOC132613274 [Lycium barbarum]